MATLRELIIKISANSNSFQTEIARASRMGSDYYKTMDQGGRKAAAATRETQKSLSALNSELAMVKSSALGLAGAWAGAFATHQLIEFADSWNQLNGRLKLASTSTDDFATAQRTLMELSQRTGTSLQANSNLYSRIAQSLRSAGYASSDVAKLTETVATSLKLSGASTEEASSVITQLSQALGSGVLRGEEFNSIMENGGRLAKLLADGLGVSIGGLRNMANTGQLTTDKIVPLLTNVEILRKEFQSLPASVGGSAQKVQNAFLAWVGGADSAVGASSTLAGVLDGLSKNIENVANTAGLLVGVGLARYFGNMVGNVAKSTAAVFSNTAAEIALAQAQVTGAKVSVTAARQTLYRAQQAKAAAVSIESQIVAEKALIAAQSGLNNAISGRASALNNLQNTTSVMSRLGSGLLGILGGWPGVIIGAGAAMYGLYQNTQQVHKEAVGFANNLEEINSKLQDMSVNGLKSTAADARTSLRAQKQDLSDLDLQIKTVKANLRGLLQIQQDYNNHPTLTYINTFMDQADITAKNIDLTDKLNKLEYQRDQVSEKVASTQKLVNDASELASKKAIEQAGVVSILNGAYDLLNKTMSATADIKPVQYSGPVVDLSNATPAQIKALDKAKRDNELASLSGLQKLHAQHLYEAEDLKLTGALYTQYVYNKDQAAKKDAAATEAKKTNASATNAQNKAERESIVQAENYARKIADLTTAIEVQKVRATQGEKASELYAASHQAGSKWTNEQRKSIQENSKELALWNQRADINVKKQRDQIQALKDLNDAAKKYKDDANQINDTKGISDRQRDRYDETQQVDRVFNKTDKGSEAVLARQEALNALANKYKSIAEAESDWLGGTSKGYQNWLENTSNVAGIVASGVTNTLDGALNNMSEMLSGSQADWRSWGLSVLQTIAKVGLQMAVVNTLKASSSFGSIFGNVASGLASISGSSTSTIGAMGLPTSFTAYDSGGFTGVGGKHDPSGIVHKGEFVFTQEATKRIGVNNLYKLMRGYSDGGYVGGQVSTPSVMNQGITNNGVNLGGITVNINSQEQGKANVSEGQGIAKQIQQAVVNTINDQASRQGTPLWRAIRGR